MPRALRALLAVVWFCAGTAIVGAAVAAMLERLRQWSVAPRP